MKAEITGVKKAEIDSVISNLKGYMNGKIYHMKASEGMNGVSTMEMLEKG